MKTQDLTICLHASDAEVANNQTKIFEYDSQLQNERTLCKQKSD